MDVQAVLAEMSRLGDELGTAPKLEEMPRLTLEDKGISGPTAAHRIEELHTPLNLAYTTFTTGTTAFQNVVGVTYPELEARKKASLELFRRLGLKDGGKTAIAYAPLMNLFPCQAFRESGIQWRFPTRSSRDAVLCLISEIKPKVLFGESAFLNALCGDAKKLGVAEILRDMVFVAAGTPLCLELLDAVADLGVQVHDLYGCQEFGWVVLDGVPLRGDVTLLPVPGSEKAPLFEVIVGGLPAGDRFPLSEGGHVCGHEGALITYRRQRSCPEPETVLKETTLASVETARRVAKSVLRIKGKIVRVSPDLATGAPRTVLEIRQFSERLEERASTLLVGPEKTELFDALVKAQLEYQRNQKTDPAWIKRG